MVRQHTVGAQSGRMPTPRASRYRLLLTGRLPTSLADVVAERFGTAAVVVVDAGQTVVHVDADQAALRSLLTLLWDVGQDVQSVSRCSGGPPRGDAAGPAAGGGP